LFYRLMIAAFMVGAAVVGVLVYIIWRFRESNKRFRVSDTTAGSRIGGSR
jgi:heme/copper-type cytochrome/quinol oxidase subunit 2